MFVNPWQNGGFMRLGQRGAMAFSSFLFALCGLFFGMRALFEKEKNYILAKLSIFLDGLLVLVWLIVMGIGLGVIR